MSRILFLFVLVFLCSTVAFAQRIWRPSNQGIDLVNTRSIIGTGNGALLIGTPRGIYRSTDRGERWSRVARGDSDVWFGTDASGYLYATNSDGVLISADDGQTWSTFATIPLSYELAVMPDGMLFTVTGDSVYRIGKNGLTETIRPSAVQYASGELATTSVDNLFYGGLHGVYRSTDRGTTWSATALHDPVGILLVDSTQVLYAVTYSLLSPSSLYRSTDLGASWTVIDTTSFSFLDIGPNGAIYKITANDSGRWLEISTDHGDTWRRSSLPGKAGTFAIARVIADSLIFTCTEGKLYRSSDYGATWNLSMTGIDQGNESVVVMISITSGALAAEFSAVAFPESQGGPPSEGIFVSTNSAADWKPLADAPGRQIMAAGNALSVVSVHGPGAGTSVPDTIAVLSLDNGASWSRGFSVGRRHGIAPGPPGVFAVPVDRRLNESGGIWVTTNNGGSWDSCAVTKSVVQAAILPSGTMLATVYALDRSPLFGQHRLLRSTDFGRSWDVVVDSAMVDTLVVGPDGTAYAWMVTPTVLTLPGQVRRRGIFRSTDDGATWSLVDSAHEFLRYAFDGAGTIYGQLSTGSTQQLFRSTDRAANWTPVLERTSINQILVTTSGSVYVLAWDSLFGSFDHGASWRPVMDGLEPAARITMIAEDVGEGLIAGTTAGLYSMSDSSAAVPGEPETPVFSFDVVPNPARSVLGLHLLLEHGGPADLDLIDPLGRVVARRSLGSFDAGEHRIPCDLSGEGFAAPGLYLVRLTVAGRMVTRAVVLVH